jgi:dienelactone hydrolase
MRSLALRTTQIITLCVWLILMISCKQKQMEEMQPEAVEPPQTFQTIQFKSMDGLDITADLYLNQDRSAPFILLFHQARYSRGEYREIAPKLVKRGFSCLAIDQRSGDAINDVINETARLAASKGMGTEYVHALPDLQAAIGFIQAEFQPETLIIWGSSYSAALSFVVANMQQDQIQGLVAFSPGTYFELNGKGIDAFASNVTCPVFMTCSQEEVPSRVPIFEAIPNEAKTFFKPDFEGFHGSKALWSQHAGHEKYWAALTTYLDTFLPKP